MGNILPELIHLDQTGFIRQRQIQDNIMRTLHIIRYVAQQEIEKAFDSFWYKVLSTFGFHKSIIETFEALCGKPSARIKINGDLSNSFILERGTRQVLFALFKEPLNQWIRQNADKGIDLSGEQKLALFADHILIFLTQTTQSLPKLMSQLSGYKFNIK